MSVRTGAQPSPPSPPPVPKPRFRGRIHQVAAFVTVPLAVVLIAIAPAGSARIASAIYGFTLVNMFTTSAIYHRGLWSPRANDRMMRLDHAAIYLLIAGTYTPFTVLGLHGATRVAILSAVWGGAGVTILLKSLRLYRLRALYGTMYIVLGWAAVLALPQFVKALPIASTVLMLVGGLLYTVGAVVLLRHKPDPNPLVFGYHEVWHVFMTSAALCHYVSLLVLVLSR